MNKHIGLFFTFFFLSHILFGQSQKPFNELISKTNEYLIQYNKLNPFNHEKQIGLKESGLPQKDIKYIQTHFDEYDGYSKDSISESNLLLEFQGLIIANIELIISHDEFNKHNIKALISDDLDLSISVSEDKKLYNFSLAEKTGGSYRSRISIMHYTEINQDNIQIQENNEKGFKTNPYLVFEGDGFHKIYTIKTATETKYVLTGYVRGCSYCFETNIMLVKFKNGVFEQDFSYAVNSRSWEEGVQYNPASKTITVDYVTDDLTTDCDCTNYAESDIEYSEYDTYNEETPLMEKRCHCTFQFNGVNFELIKESWEKTNP